MSPGCECLSPASLSFKIRSRNERFLQSCLCKP